jgi:hypothetical protein
MIKVYLGFLIFGLSQIRFLILGSKIVESNSWMEVFAQHSFQHMKDEIMNFSDDSLKLIWVEQF